MSEQPKQTRYVLGEGYLFGFAGSGPALLVGLSSSADDADCCPVPLACPPIHQTVAAGDTVERPQDRRRFRLVLEVVEESPCPK